MSKDNFVYLRHILDAIDRIEEYVKGAEYQLFIDNNLIQAGVIREIEIIGEATKRLSSDFKEKYPDIPWKRIAGTRDKLIHENLGVDLDAVWETVIKDIPDLKNKVREIIKK